ncbi:MAG: hypothetical protein MOB07_02520 [Acidobacteria bacterium]|nr:hypothetical protein [Acidobacteriota bacterium]
MTSAIEKAEDAPNAPASSKILDTNGQEDTISLNLLPLNFFGRACAATCLFCSEKNLQRALICADLRGDFCGLLVYERREEL